MKLDLNAAALAVALALGGTGAAFAASPDQPAAGPSGMPVQPQNAALAVPGTVDAGQTVNVVVNGAPKGSRIELWGPIGVTAPAGQISTSPLIGGTARLDAPAVPASYEIRYLGPDGVVHARQAFDVASVPVALSVLTPVRRGESLDVTWQGPAAPGDRFEIVGPTGAVLDSTPVAGSAGTANLSSLTVPQETGRMQLRYVTGQGAVLRSVPFDAY